MLTYTILNQMNQGASVQSCSNDQYYVALYGNGTPVNTGTTLVSTEYGASWNTCTEIAASGTYVAGGASVTAPTSSQSGNLWEFSCTTPNSWTSATLLNVYGCLIYDHTKSPAYPGLVYLDFLGNQGVTSGTFTITYQPLIAKITCT